VKRIATRTIIGVMTATLIFATSPAHAGTRTFTDKVGDTSQDGIADIGTVKITNTKKSTAVTVRIPREQPEMRAVGATRIYLDTDRKKSGPEYLWFVSYPGEAYFVPVKKGKEQHRKVWYNVAKATKCAKTVRETFSPSDGVFGIKIKHKKGCLGNPKSVRVNIRTTVFSHFDEDDYEQTTYPSPENDYYPSHSGYTRSVKR
jgi:hypothetical protein